MHHIGKSGQGRWPDPWGLGHGLLSLSSRTAAQGWHHHIDCPTHSPQASLTMEAVSVQAPLAHVTLVCFKLTKSHQYS